MTDIYYPKGGMCMSCANIERHCEFIDFKSMPIILKPPLKTNEDRFIEVKCIHYINKNIS